MVSSILVDSFQFNSRAGRGLVVRLRALFVWMAFARVVIPECDNTPMVSWVTNWWLSCCAELVLITLIRGIITLLENQTNETHAWSTSFFDLLLCWLSVHCDGFVWEKSPLCIVYTIPKIYRSGSPFALLCCPTLPTLYTRISKPFSATS